jgi:hypothetical protein
MRLCMLTFCLILLAIGYPSEDKAPPDMAHADSLGIVIGRAPTYIHNDSGAFLNMRIQ